MIEFRHGDRPPIDTVIALYRATSLGARRPVDDRDRMAGMFENSNILVTAWDDGRLVGLSRAMTDLGWVVYVADLLVHEHWQRRGIGAELLEQTHKAAGGEDDITLILVAAPEAMTYYQSLGYDKIAEGWRRSRRTNPLLIGSR